MIGEPPLLTGAVQVRSAWALQCDRLLIFIFGRGNILLAQKQVAKIVMHEGTTKLVTRVGSPIQDIKRSFILCTSTMEVAAIFVNRPKIV